MLTIDHRIGPSTIHGIGVFSNEDIKKGQLVWRFSPVVDKEVHIEDVLAMPDHVVRIFARHAFYVEERGTFIIGADGDYFMNHSDDPNLVDDGKFMHAARDIEPGEELTCDYGVVKVVEFDPGKGKAHAKTIQDFYKDICLRKASSARGSQRGSSRGYEVSLRGVESKACRSTTTVGF